MDVGREGDKLLKPNPLKVIAQGVAFCSTDVDVPDDQSVLFRVDQVS